MYPNFTPE
jgi:accessory colonization factor AcfC